MGFLDFIKPKSALEKAAKQVREEYAKPEYRREAMEKLLKIGSEEAYDALLERFAVKANGQIADEQEKKELEEECVALDAKVVASLTRYIRTKKKALTFPIRALGRIIPKEETKSILVEALALREPTEHSSTEAKIALIDALADYLTADELHVLYPYLEDTHDDVQVGVLAVIERLKPPAAKEHLTKVCASEIHSGRVQRSSAELLAKLEFSVREQYEAFEPELKELFVLGKKGQLVARPWSNQPK